MGPAAAVPAAAAGSSFFSSTAFGLIASTIGGALISGLMAPKGGAPKTSAPAVMPDADDQALRLAARRKSMAQRQQSGRLSTDNTSASSPKSTVLG